MNVKFRRLLVDSSFVWYRPRDGITRHNVHSPAIPDRWKPSPSRLFKIEGDELVYSPSQVLMPPSEAIWFGIEEKGEEYKPFLQYPLLHRTFSALHCEPDAIQELADKVQEFASKYGLLGVSSPYMIHCPNNLGEKKPLVVQVESLTQWDSEIEDLRNAVDFRDSLRTDDRAVVACKLEGLIQRTDKGFWYQPRSLERALSAKPGLKDTIEEYHRVIEEWGSAFIYDSRYIAGPGYHDEFLERWRDRSDIFGPAQQYLVSMINEKLMGNVTPQFWLAKDTESKEWLRTIVTPQNLLGALWLQLFLEVTPNSIRRCPVCHKWFDSPDSRQIYCRERGSGCRKKADRIRSELLSGKSRDNVAKKHGITQDDVDEILKRSSKK